MRERDAGRAPRFRNTGELQARIDGYFEWCAGRTMTDPDTGEVMRDKQGQPMVADRHPPTVCGLAESLGFPSRVSLLQYRGKRACEALILRAMLRVERFNEEQLYSREGSSGAKFSLQNNFRGWKDEKDLSLSLPEDDGVMAEVRSRLDDDSGM